MMVMKKKGSCYGCEVVGPFMVMVVMEGCNIGLTILTKTAMASYGMSPFVFIVYTNVVASILLLPHTFTSLSDRSVMLTLPLLLRFFFMGLTGVTMAQNLAFVGLSYSSPYMVCAMGLLIPTFSFFLSIILRRTKVGWRSSSFWTKVVGSMVSIMGAIMVIFYKGPVIEKASLSSFHGHQHLITKLLVFSSTNPQYWVLGGVLLACASLSISVWNIIQMDTVKKYPEVMRIVSFYSIIGTIQCLAVSLFFERDPNAWKVKVNKELLLIVVTAVFGSMIRTRVQVWCMQAKGPFYVPMFKPFGIVYATSFGVAFFATTLHYGSVVATCIIGMGYYTSMWGQIKEEEELTKENDYIDDDKKVPLLQEEDSKV